MGGENQEWSTDGEKDISKEKVDVKLEDLNVDEESLDALKAKNGDSSPISKSMAEEEEKLLETRVKEEDAANVEGCEEVAKLTESQFTKLDELLTQTQLYSEFLLEKMDDITLNGAEEQETEPVQGRKRGRGSKRKATTAYNNRKAKRAVAAMLTRSQDGADLEDFNLTEEERAEKEQAELVPLLTGGKLKPYQIKGVKWLISLWQNGLNGILADQMGLGKTIQTIGFLAHLKGKGLDGPYLIIAPLSTLSNWVNEISRFAPMLNAIIYHGDKHERNEIRKKHMPRSIGPKFPIIVTSYEVALFDAQKHLRHYSWKYVVVDEFHDDVSKEEVEEKRRVQVIAKLHAILRPFLLRRMKSDVEQMLPRKKEIILYATMTEHQRNFQNHLINRTLEEHLREKDFTGRGMKGKLNNLMIQLRKTCNHPDLLESAFDGSYSYPPLEQIVEQCGKFRLLDRLLTRLFDRKHKVLIFSQWTKILDIMDYYFSEKGFEVCRIDGSVKLHERQSQIKEFNDPESIYRIFLLSTRAGGLGINLTSADTCILYDSDWCRIMKRAYSKLKLEHVVIEKGQFQQERAKPNSADIMEEEDLLALLQDNEDDGDKMIQTDISDEDLERILDRSDLVSSGLKDDHKPTPAAFPLKGPGWEVVIPSAGGSMLSTLNS
ncbi:SNF2, N-terminal [Dillenia turbinata]|uniref:SNF2, N-terminal n=1 Tax=Dillenia turbinata TaxID=194707 RepID=A0AAN8VAS2_9MAGN